VCGQQQGQGREPDTDRITTGGGKGMYWVQIGLLVVLVSLALWQGAVALHSVIEKVKEEKPWRP